MAVATLMYAPDLAWGVFHSVGLSVGADGHGASFITHWYTKAEFQQLELHKTKAQVRDEWGPPDQVWDDENTWVYIRLPIKDAVADTPMFATTFHFVGDHGASETVEFLSYQ